MSWKKYFRMANTSGALSPISGYNAGRQESLTLPNADFRNYGGILPEVYMGHPNRIERYNQYEAMDVDSEVNAALDIISEFSTQNSDENQTPFKIDFKDQPTETEIKLIKKQLQAWCHLNEFDRRMFKIFRNVLKYGDQVFVRDPENFKLYWVDMTNIVKIIVNESEGKKPEQYVVRNLNINLQNLSVTQVTADNVYHTMPNTAGYGAAAYNMPNNPYVSNSRFMLGMHEVAVDAENIVHLSLSEGLDANWPFGSSVLENIFKVYKQKELLEDAIIIYRIQRAPERRVFYVDVGNMPSHMAMAFVDRIKNEIHQRRIPTQMGGCFTLDTEIPLLDGRVLSLNQLIDEHNSGKENWIYSCDPATGKPVPGVISWAGITRRNSEVVKLSLDNGQVIHCTPDHKFPILGKGKVEARDILINQDCLIGFHTQNIANCEQIYNHSTKDWMFTRNMLSEFVKDRGKNQQVTTATDSLDNQTTYCHKVTAIEYLPNLQDVGTITVDGKEQYHGFHTFALKSGVFTFNSNFMDSTYNPLSVGEDYFFPVTAEGRGSKVELLPGGSNIGEIDDLKYFTNKMFRGLRIPSSYLPTGAEDSASILNDGKVATALIQEYRFNQYCQRLQSLVCPILDSEFKAFLKWRGITIDTSLFEISLNEPQNFAAYRQVDLDSARIQQFAQVEGFKYLSKRFIMKRYLGLSEAEITENASMWREENLKPTDDMIEMGDLRDVGVTPGTIESDMKSLETAEAPMEMPGGPETSAPEVVPPTAPPSGEAAAPPA